MAEIKKIYEDGARTQDIYPITHEKAVIDNNGTTAETKFQMIKDLVNQKQMEVGAVPSDFRPTKGSNNWVTSGGVFSEFVDYSLKSGVSVPLVWYAGSLNQNHVYLSSTTRIVATCQAQEMAVKIASGYWCSIHEYSTELGEANTINDGSSWMGNTYEWFDGGAFITPSSGAKSFVLIMSKGDKTGNISVAESVNCEAKSFIADGIADINDVLYGKPSGVVTETAIMEQGGLNPDGKKSPSSADVHNYRIRTANPIKVNGEFSVQITGNYYFNIHFYQTSDLSTWVSAYASGGWVTSGSATTEWNGYIMLIAKSSSDDALTPSSTTLTVTKDAYEKGLIEEVEELTTDTENYVYGADMMKKEIKVDEIGDIYYGQAFCVYNGHFFSTDGSHIAEQDENLSLVRTASVNVGHGNSFQLVSNGKVWASGWNDQKMYKVDLSTLTIEQTITLPTTGYTTAAVDEDGGKMYILQRDTNPNYIGQYTWMVYDIQTGVIESTRKIDSFAALQSMDYYRGKIFMLYGIVPPDAPSGMRVYNTNGDVLAEFKIKVFANTEPEGICFDEDTYTLYVSNQPKKLYKITAK